MDKIEIDMKLWIEIFSTFGYTIGICEGVCYNITSADNLKIGQNEIENNLITCIGKIGNTLYHMTEACND